MQLTEFDIISETIKTRRKIRRITQKQMALRVGVSPRTIFALEKGDTSISVKTLLEVASVLNLRLAVFHDKAKMLRPPAKLRPNANKTKDVWGWH